MPESLTYTVRVWVCNALPDEYHTLEGVPASCKREYEKVYEDEKVWDSFRIIHSRGVSYFAWDNLVRVDFEEE